jgi:undecaprenyl-diphosphatase
MTAHALAQGHTLDHAGLTPRASLVLSGISTQVTGLRRQAIGAVLWIVMGGLAVYFLLPQIGGLQASLHALRAVEPVWLMAGLGLVTLRYSMTAVSVQAAVGRPLPFRPTLLVQVSAAFVGRLTPEGIGWLVLNQRYLERSGLGRPSAVAAIALKVLAGLVVRLVIMVAVAALLGSGLAVPVTVPASWPQLLAVGLGVGIVALILWSAFRATASRAIAPVAAAARDLALVFRQPWRAATLLGASALATISYPLLLAVSLTALGVDASPVEVFAVYLGGTAVASLSPTPGNIGAVEVALSAGLTAIGVPTSSAIAAVLIYRLLTFWLPVVPGFIAFRYLHARGQF